MSSVRIAFAACVLVVALGAGSWGAVHAFPLSTIVVLPAAHDAAGDENLPADEGPPQQARTTPGQLPPPPPPPRDPRMPPPPPPPPPSAQGEEMPESFRKTIERLHPVRIGGAMKPPTKVKDVRPRYPEEAMASGIEGTVILEAIVDGAGSVADTRIVKGVPDLNEAAQKAVAQWEFTPTLLNGEPTAIICTVTVTFHVR